jgi:hypothetical protein
MKILLDHERDLSDGYDHYYGSYEPGDVDEILKIIAEEILDAVDPSSISNIIRNKTFKNV